MSNKGHPLRAFFDALSAGDDASSSSSSSLDLAAIERTRTAATVAPFAVDQKQETPQNELVDYRVDVTQCLAGTPRNPYDPRTWLSVPLAGDGLTFAREGSAPDVRFTVRINGSDTYGFRPGDSIRGMSFKSFAVKPSHFPRSHYEAGKHLARLVIERGRATFREHPTAPPLFRPVPLTAGSDIYGTGGSALGETLFKLSAPVWGSASLLNVTGFSKVRLYFSRPASETGGYDTCVFVPWLFQSTAAAGSVAAYPLHDRILTVQSPAATWPTSYPRSVVLDVSGLTPHVYWDKLNDEFVPGSAPVYVGFDWPTNTGTATTIKYFALGVE